MAPPATTDRATRTKDVVLQVAIEEFAAKGFHGADVQVIADRAGRGRGRSPGLEPRRPDGGGVVMRRRATWAFGVSGLFLAALVLAAIPARGANEDIGPGDQVGTWQLKFSLPAGEQEAVLVLSKDGDGVEGTYEFDSWEFPAQDVSFATRRPTSARPRGRSCSRSWRRSRPRRPRPPRRPTGGWSRTGRSTNWCRWSRGA